MISDRDLTKKIKGALLTIGIMMLGGILLMFALRSQQTVSDQNGMTAETQNATFVVGGIHHTIIEEGMKDLDLIADSAVLHMDENRANLSMLQATFFEKTGEDVILSAESGNWMMDSNDLEVSGNVMLKTKELEMRTETLTYIDSKRMVTTQSLVTIKGFLGEELPAEGMTYYLDSKRIYLNGNEAER